MRSIFIKFLEFMSGQVYSIALYPLTTNIDKFFKKMPNSEIAPQKLDQIEWKLVKIDVFVTLLAHWLWLTHSSGIIYIRKHNS